MPHQKTTSPAAVAAVVLNWNTPEYTIPCVHSLLLQTHANLGIVVVDNGSEDDSAAQIREEFGERTVVLSITPNRGFAGGANAGIRYAIENGFDYVFLTNNDTIIHERLIEELLTVAEQDPGIGMVTGKIYYFEPRDLLWYAGGDLRLGLTMRFSHRGCMHKDEGQFDRPCECSFVTGCCMFVPCRVFEKIGMFDESLVCYGEDADLSLRALACGYRLMYNPRAVLWHKESAAIRKSTLGRSRGTISAYQYYYSSRNQLLLLRRHCGRLAKVTSICLLVARLLARVLATALWGRREKSRAIWQGIVDGLFAPRRGPGHEIAFGRPPE